MKRKLVMIILSGLLSLGVVGCQNGSSPGNAAKPTSSPVPAATASSGQKAAGIGGITQEEAGIKLRVDMPEIKPFLEQRRFLKASDSSRRKTGLSSAITGKAGCQVC